MKNPTKQKPRFVVYPTEEERATADRIARECGLKNGSQWLAAVMRMQIAAVDGPTASETLTQPASQP